MDDMIQKIRQSACLISLPEIYLQLKELLDDPDFTMAEVALLVGRDPGMAVRFLRIVNSPLYGRPAKIETVHHAVSMLGSRQVHDIVLSASVCAAFDGIPADVMDMHRFWQRSVYCAVTVRQLALESEEMESERLFLNGLLHDIGHLFMYLGIPEKAQRAILLAREQERPLYLVERELLGFDYAYLAGLMMNEWGLPKSLEIPLAFHPEPSGVSQFASETALLHLASLLVQADLEAGAFGVGAFLVDPAAWQLTGLTEEHCLDARQTAAEQFGAVAESLFGHVRQDAVRSRPRHPRGQK
jgi:HD-like signal output (HDOD) protein